MAFTEAERVKIRALLGWPARFHQTQPALEQALNAAEALPDTKAKILEWVAAADVVDAAMVDARSRMKALKVGSIELPGGTEVAQLVRQGRMYSGRISSTLLVPIVGDYWTAAGGSAAAPVDNLLMVC